MLKGFKDFLFRGNIVDLAVAVVVGTAFTALVTAFTNAIIQPVLNAIGGDDAANGLGFSLRHGSEAIEKATFVDLGAVINALITFVITAAVVYFIFVVPSKKLMERLQTGEEAEPEGPTEDILLLREIRDALGASAADRTPGTTGGEPSA